MNRQPSPRLKSVNPILTVQNLKAALDYYQSVLSFQVAWTWGDPLTLASVCRDDVELNLASSRTDTFGPSHHYIQLRGVDAYYAKIIAAGGQVTIPLADRNYGMRDFRLIDRDGNELSFGEPITS